MLCLRHLSLISHRLLVKVTVWAAPAQIECGPSLGWFFTQRFARSLRWSQSKTRRPKGTQTNSRVCGLGFSTLWTCLNYLQVVVQDKVNASQQLHEGQDVREPKVILPWFPCCEIPVLPAVSLCSSCSPCSVCSCPSAPALTSAHPRTSGSWPTAFPADGYGGCSWNAGDTRLSCFIQCCLGQISTVC